MLAQELLNVGMNNQEANVYVAALQLGYSSIQDLSTKAGMNRTTAYTHVNNLISRGLLNTLQKGGRQVYIAERPEKLKYIYEQKEQELKRKRELLDQLLPELESIYTLAQGRPNVRFLNLASKEESDIYQHEIETQYSREMHNIFNYERHKQYINKDHIRRVLENTGQFYALYIANGKFIDQRIFGLAQAFDNFHLRYLPASKFDFLCEILIADDFVHIIRGEDGLRIADRLFSQTLGLLFQALWGIGEDV